VLVLVVMMTFVFCGFAALVIDLGFARLAQRQMQTAVDSAALEGLRWRDDIPSQWYTPGNATYDLIVAAVGPPPQIAYDPTNALWKVWIDGARRWAASQIVANTFGVDLNPLDGGPLYFGAGPVVQFQEGSGINVNGLQAGQTIEPPGPSPVYQPGLELNLNNAPNGDQVAGAYGMNNNYPESTSPADEDGNYNRRDFQPAPATQSPYAPAMLARLRRTANPLGLDQLTGISSGGPTIPYLFGWGTMMQPGYSSGPWPQQQGVTVRATAIAAAEDNITFGNSTYNAGRAKAVGRSNVIPATGNPPALTIPGVAPFALEGSFWASLSPGSPSVTLNLVPLPGPPARVEIQTSAGGTVGLLLMTTTDAITSHVAASATSIGQPPQLLAPNGSAAGFDDSALLQDAAGTGVVDFVPIYTTAPLGGQTWTVIGFGYLYAGQWTYTPANQQLAQAATLTIAPPVTTSSTGVALPPHVAGQNASGVLGLALPGSFSQQDVIDLFQLHGGFVSDPNLNGFTPLTNALYAPVLVDHYIRPNTQTSTP